MTEKSSFEIPPYSDPFPSSTKVSGGSLAKEAFFITGLCLGVLLLIVIIGVVIYLVKSSKNGRKYGVQGNGPAEYMIKLEETTGDVYQNPDL